MALIDTKIKVVRTTIIEIPDLGERIKRARENDNRTLTKICKLAGMTTSNWYRIEKGETKSLPEHTLTKMEKALGVDLGVNFKEVGKSAA